MNRIYHLDGKPVTLKALAKDHGWPYGRVLQAMRSATPPATLNELRAAIVRARSAPPYRPTPTDAAKRAMVELMQPRPLTKLARMGW